MTSAATAGANAMRSSRFMSMDLRCRGCDEAYARWHSADCCRCANQWDGVGPGRGLPGLEQRREQVDREREDDGRVLLAADLQQRLQVAQLDRDRVAADDVGG